MANKFAGHQGTAGRGTNRTSGVVVGKLHSLFCQLVDVGRLEMGLSIDTQVPVAEVIRQDVNDIGLFRRGAEINDNKND